MYVIVLPIDGIFADRHPSDNKLSGALIKVLSAPLWQQIGVKGSDTSSLIPIAHPEKNTYLCAT